jgi:hypothetical protein
MTRQNNIYAPQQKLLHIIHRAHSGFLSHATKTFHRKNDEGGMLIEVLVALLILAIVFTSTTLALSNLAGQRVSVEQRDRAVSLITEYEERSRLFRCGLLVDKPDDAADRAAFETRLSLCDFGAAINGAPQINAGDQEFRVTDGALEFEVSIRYWWEQSGTSLHESTCPNIASSAETLPAILVRAFEVRWTEKGSDFRERLIKKDPAPLDSAVFATGNRSNYLLGITPDPDNALVASLKFYSDTDGVRTNRIYGGNVQFPGQPQDCMWFPYIGTDQVSRYLTDDIASGYPSSPVPAEEAGGWRLVL